MFKCQKCFRTLALSVISMTPILVENFFFVSVMRKSEMPSLMSESTRAPAWHWMNYLFQTLQGYSFTTVSVALTNNTSPLDNRQGEIKNVNSNGTINVHFWAQHRSLPPKHRRWPQRPARCRCNWQYWYSDYFRWNLNTSTHRARQPRQ